MYKEINKYKFGILVSTMFKNDFSLLKDMNISSNATVVNQTDIKEDFIDIKQLNNGKIVNWINTGDRGLSKSRNKAIQNANFDIVMLADDDLIYVDNVESIVLKAFEENPEFDILIFQVHGLNEHFKNYKNKEKIISYLGSMKHASVEISFNLNKIKEKNIEFNELFGSGSEYSMGEDNIFLFDCLKKGLRIKYLPIKIADLYIGESTWFKGYTEKYFYDLGTIYSEMSLAFSLILIIQFSIRKYKIYKNDIGFYKALKTMLKGRKDYSLKK